MAGFPLTQAYRQSGAAGWPLGGGGGVCEREIERETRMLASMVSSGRARLLPPSAPPLSTAWGQGLLWGGPMRISRCPTLPPTGALRKPESIEAVG